MTATESLVRWRDRAGELLAGHPHHAALAALNCGLAASAAGASLLAMAVAGAAVIVVLTSLRAPALGLACAAAVLTGAVVAHERLAAIDAPGQPVSNGMVVDDRAILLERPRPSAFGSSALVELTTGRATGARLLAQAPEEVSWPDGASPGDEVLIAGFAQRPRGRPDAPFDWAAHLRRRGVAGELEVVTVEDTGRSRDGLCGAVDAARSRAELALGAGIDSAREALVRGMVLGQDEAIDELTRQDFRSAGLAHILAVSGQNVMLLGLLAMPMLVAAGLGPRARLLVLGALIAAYVPLAGAGASLQRAAAMGSAGLLALALGRPASRWYGLLLAAAATLLVNPRVSGDPGWQLSFAAVVGILLLGPSLRRAMSELPRVLAEGVAMTVSATLATGPLLAHHFDAVSLAGLPANLLALPAVAPAMWIGMLQVGVGQLAVLGEPFMGLSTALAGILGTVNGPLLSFIGWVAARFAELPGAQVAVDLRSPVGLGAAYLGEALVIAGAIRVERRAGPAATAGAGRWRTLPRARRFVIAVGCACALALLAAEVTGPGTPPDRLTVSFLDVGQGDATLIQHPDGASALFDAGPVEARVVRQVRRAGVERLSMLVATHASADHHGGLREVIERIPTDLLLDGGDGNTDPTFERRSQRPTATASGVLRPSRVSAWRLAGCACRSFRRRRDRPGRPRRTRTRVRSWPSSAQETSICCCPGTPRARRSRPWSCRTWRR